MRILPMCAIVVLTAMAGPVPVTPTSRLTFAASSVPVQEGTLQVAVRLSEVPEERSLPLVSIGQNDPVWWLLSLRGRELSWLMENHGKLKLPGTYYVRLTHRLSESPKGSWLYVAVTWKRGEKGHSSVALYVNGRQVGARHDLDLPGSLGKALSVGVGCNTADARAPGIAGELAAFAVDGRVLSVEEIEANQARIEAGKELTPGSSTTINLLPPHGWRYPQTTPHTDPELPHAKP